MMEYKKIAADVILGHGVQLRDFINLYGCSIGNDTRIGTFVEIQKGVSIGPNCKIQSHTFICEGVTIEENVFVGHGVMFINDNHPRAVTADGQPESEADWKSRLQPIVVKKGASIGSNATILGGVTIGEGAIVGAGTVVVDDVPPGVTVVGNPGRILKK
jgi:UDP-2-acetamido-3-amino-2,3-dideoxy-glucuronate N-acetyltransferase